MVRNGTGNSGPPRPTHRSGHEMADERSYWLIAPLPQWRQKKVRSLVAALTA